MAKIIFALAFSLFSLSESQAMVGLYHYDSCQHAWLKRARGFHADTVTLLGSRRSKPATAAAQDASVEVEQASLKVYETYRAVLIRAGKPLAFVEAFIQGLIQEDKDADKKKVFYFVYRHPSTNEVQGVIRVLVAKEGEVAEGFLKSVKSETIEQHLQLAKNRVIFSRIVSVPRPKQTPVSKELAYTVASFLGGVFPDQNFHIYAETDFSRARLYRQKHHFDLLATPQETGTEDLYIVGMAGQAFIEIYFQHIFRAYEAGIKERDPNRGLALLQLYEETFHLQDYGPTQHAKRHLEMMRDIFSGKGIPAFSALQQLTKGDKVDANLDFEIIFYARAIYDLMTYRGSAARAGEVIRRHLEYLASRGLAHARRTRHLEELHAVLRAHEGKGIVPELSKERRKYGMDFFARDKENFLRFVDDFFKNFPQGLAGEKDNPDASKKFMALKQDHLDSAFHDFVTATNPLIHFFLAKIYDTWGQGDKASMLRDFARSAVLPEERAFYDLAFEQFEK